MGVTVLPAYARDRASLSLAVEPRNSPPDALLIGGDGLSTSTQSHLSKRLEHGVPVVHYWLGIPEMGALLSHHSDIRKNYERTAYYLNRILKGAKPGDLPVERPARYELVLSRKAAHAFGISIALDRVAWWTGSSTESIPMKVLIVDDHALIRDALGRVLISLVPDAAVLEAGEPSLPFRR